MIGIAEADELEELPYIEDSPINLKVHSMIDEVRRLKLGYHQRVRIVTEAK